MLIGFLITDKIVVSYRLLVMGLQFPTWKNGLEIALIFLFPTWKNDLEKQIGNYKTLNFNMLQFPLWKNGLEIAKPVLFPIRFSKVEIVKPIQMTHQI